MDDMIERVAKAIFLSQFTTEESDWPDRVEYCSIHGADGFRDAARAAIAAMRDVPDWLMMVGGNTPISNVGKTGSGRKGRIGDIAAREAFERMIDASLRITASDIPTPSPT